MNKKISRLFFGFTLVLSSLALSGCNFHREKVWEGDWLYTRDAPQKHFNIAGYSGAETVVTVPSEFRDLPIRAIDTNAFRNHRDITSLTLPDTIEVFSDSAFQNMSNLVTINMPASLEVIADDAFKGVSKLQELLLPDSVEVIGDSAFENMSSLVSINIPTGLDILGDKAFKNCTSLSVDIIIDGSLDVIGSSAFEGASSLTYVYLAKNVDVLSSNVFKGCSSLLNIDVEHERRPFSWDEDWNPDNNHVTWGVTQPRN